MMGMWCSLYVIYIYVICHVDLSFTESVLFHILRYSFVMWLRCCDHCDLLSSRGLDLGILNSNGHSALHKAAVKGNHQVCEWHGFQVRFQFSCSLTSSFWPSFIEFSQSVGGFETFGDVSSSFFGHHFEAFGPRRLGRAPGGETLQI